MSGVLRLLAGVAVVACCRAQSDCKPQAPCYSANDVVNIASGVAGAVAPNTLASIYGVNLSYSQRAVSLGDISAGRLPTAFPGTGVQVNILQGQSGFPAQLYLVSPAQINFLTPSNLIAGDVAIQVVRDGVFGPARPLKLSEAAPALFQLETGVALVSRFDYSLVTPQAPAKPGEWIILWATGLGAVTPPLSYGMLPTRPAWIARPELFRVLIDGTPVSPERIAYAGVAVGYAGLYHVNLRLPLDTPSDPEIRLLEGDALSPAGVRLPVSP